MIDVMITQVAKGEPWLPGVVLPVELKSNKAALPIVAGMVPVCE